MTRLFYDFLFYIRFRLDGLCAYYFNILLVNVHLNIFLRETSCKVFEKRMTKVIFTLTAVVTQVQSPSSLLPVFPICSD